MVMGLRSDTAVVFAENSQYFVGILEISSM
jgi:hypothetical protein